MESFHKIQYVQKILFVFDPQEQKVIEGISYCIQQLSKALPKIILEFHLIQKPENACALISDTITIHQQFYQKYKHIIPKGCKLYSGEQIPKHVILIGNGQLFSRCARLFQNMDTPFIMAFAYGDDPRNFNFVLSEIKAVFPVYIEQIRYSRNPSYQKLMKLQVTKIENKKEQSESQQLEKQDNKNEVNEFFGDCVDQIQFHRGIASVLKLDLFIKNDCFQKPAHLAQLWGDGILISTPMGSLGRSLSLHGPLMHKQMNCIMIVPNCPLSMKFRPICVPISNKLIIQVQRSSRAPSTFGMDGMNRGVIHQGSKVQIGCSQYHLRLVTGLIRSYDITWLRGLKRTISWAQNYSSPSKKAQQKAKI